MKTKFRNIFLIAAALLTSASFSQDAHALVMEWDLYGRGYGGFGDEGLYLGPNFNSSNYGRSKYEFEFKSVKLQINSSTGDGKVFGDIRHRRTGDIWVMDMTLTGFVFRENGTGTATSTKHFDSSLPYDGMFEDLYTAPVGSGIEWNDIFLTIDKKHDTGVRGSYRGPTVWDGWAMPDIGHWREAEFALGSNGKLWFDAWYQADTQNRIDSGDTKTKAKNPRIVEGNEVPEPSTVALLGLGLLGAFFSRKKLKS